MTDQTDGTLEVPNKFIPSPRFRAWLYGVVAAVLVVLVAVGVLAPDVSNPILAVVGAVLGIGTSTLALVNTPK